MGNKEECAKFFKKVLGLEFSDQELEAVWTHFNRNQFTPTSKHGGNIAGFTPFMLYEFINLSLQRTNTTLQDPQYKKVVEEVLPALIFTLLLKKLGLGEFLIASSDSPDIFLINFSKEEQERKTPRAQAIPLESIYLPQRAVEEAAGNTSAEKIAGIVMARKFIKRYDPLTYLLITINARMEELDPVELSSLLYNKENRFKEIWIFLGLGADDCLMIRLTPTYIKYELNVKNDLHPLFY